MEYQVRCLDCQPRVPDPAPRDIRAVNGEAGFKLECSVSGRGSDRRVTFSAEHQSESAANRYLLQVRSAKLGGEDTDGPCEVRSLEGDNTYVASCGSDTPTRERQCQIELRQDDDDKGVLKGKLYCDKMPSDASLNNVRSLVAPNTSADPAEFELYGCAGL
jgi:hypothetical protein